MLQKLKKDPLALLKLLSFYAGAYWMRALKIRMNLFVFSKTKKCNNFLHVDMCTNELLLR